MGNEQSSSSSSSQSSKKFPGQGHSLKPNNPPPPTKATTNTTNTNTSASTNTTNATNTTNTNTTNTNTSLKSQPKRSASSSSASSAVPTTPDAEEDVGDVDINGIEREMDEILFSVQSEVNASAAISALDMLVKLCAQIIDHPEDVKYRRIRTENPVFKSRLAAIPAATALMVSIGFVPMSEGEETVLYFDGKLVVLKRARTKLERLLMELRSNVDLVKPAAALTISNDPPPQAATSTVVRDRETLLLLPSSRGVDPSNFFVPDNFFEVTTDDIKGLLTQNEKKQQQRGILMTKSMRDRFQGDGRNKFQKCIIRIRFPEGVFLQGTFLPRERIQSLYKFVTENTTCSDRKFRLSTQPPVVQLVPSNPDNLLELGLVPATLINLWWEDKQLTSPDAIFPPQLLSHAIEL